MISHTDITCDITTYDIIDSYHALIILFIIYYDIIILISYDKEKIFVISYHDIILFL